MKIKNQTVMAPSFIPAVEKLLKLELPVKDCMQLAKSIREMNEQLALIDKAKTGIMDRFVVKDDNSQIQVEEDGKTPKFKTEDGKKEFLKALVELLSEDFDISLENKIKIPDNAKFTTEDFVSVEDLIEV